MKPVLTVRQVKATEQAAIQNGLSEDILIENASAAVTRVVEAVSGNLVQIAKKTRRCRILIVAGCGNNGADGLSAARLLHLLNYEVLVVCMAENFNPFVKKRYDAAKYLQMNVSVYNGVLPDCDILIDAVFGTGLREPLSGIYTELVEKINRLPCYKISVDIPSGLNADTGEIMGAAIKADETVTFSSAKHGHFLNGAAQYTGKLTVADIGILPMIDTNTFFLAQDDRGALPRKRVSHKYDYGFVKIIAGSDEMPGAAELARITAEAALKGGAGLCCLCVPNCLKDIFRQAPGEAMYAFLPDKDGQILYDEPAFEKVLQKAAVVLIGPGLGRTPETAKIISYVCRNFSGMLILDADGLNALADFPDCICVKKCRLVLSPHAGEFERLTKHFTFGSDNLIDRVTEYAAAIDACIIYKSDLHIIAYKRQAFINTLLTPALAKGGSGDVLAGLLAAFFAKTPQDRSVFPAVHASLAYALAAQNAVLKTGEESLLPSELIPFLKG